MRQAVRIHSRLFAPSRQGYPIIVFQSPQTRAINAGYLRKRRNGTLDFVPGRLNVGSQRIHDTYQATLQTLALPVVRAVLRRYPPRAISTITVLRETLSCQLPTALAHAGIIGHYGDAFIGARHIKGRGAIRTAYLYENTEGLANGGLWLVADSICIGRNLVATLTSVLRAFHPKELLFLCPIASRRGIDNVGAVIARHRIPTTFVAWGALFGVDEETLYDMPWGHPDTEALDRRDQQLLVSIFGPKLCVGGDFGNNYFCPSLALKLYEDQLKQHRIRPNMPRVADLRRLYQPGELLTREDGEHNFHASPP